MISWTLVNQYNYCLKYNSCMLQSVPNIVCYYAVLQFFWKIIVELCFRQSYIIVFSIYYLN